MEVPCRKAQKNSRWSAQARPWGTGRVGGPAKSSRVLAESISVWCRNAAWWFCQSCGSGVRRGRWPPRAGLVSRCFSPRARLGPTSNGLPFGNRYYPTETIRHPFDHICPEHGIEYGFTQLSQLYFPNGQVKRRSRTIAKAKARRYCYRTAKELKKHPQAFSLAYPTPNARMACAASHCTNTGMPGGRKVPLVSTPAQSTSHGDYVPTQWRTVGT